MLDRYLVGPEMRHRWTELHGNNVGFKGQDLAAEYAHMRSGVITGTEIVSPESFDEAINLVYDDIFDFILEKGLVANPDKTVCVFLWRAACAALESAYRKGFRRALHLGVSRDEHTGRAKKPYYIGERADQKISPDTDVLLIDPMLASGTTFEGAIRHFTNLGVDPKRIKLAAMISAAPGMARLLREYPVTIVVGKSDGAMNNRMYISEPGLGDAGDKAARAFSQERIDTWCELQMMTDKDRRAFHDRMAGILS